MAKLTKESPGCYHQLLDYLSQKTGIAKYKTLTLIESDLYYIDKNGKQKCKYSYKPLKCFNSDGVWHHPKYSSNRLCEFGKMLDMRKPYLSDSEFKFDYYTIDIRLNITDFDVKLNKCGKYRDSLGGGWYSDIDLFELDGLYFAPDFDCSCC